MTRIDESEFMFAETLHPANIPEPLKVKPIEVKLVATRYGDKRVMVLSSGKQVFLNSISLKNLVEAFGEETDNWLGKEVTVTTIKDDRTQGKASVVIVINKETAPPKAEEEEVKDEKKKA